MAQNWPWGSQVADEKNKKQNKNKTKKMAIRRSVWSDVISKDWKINLGCSEKRVTYVCFSNNKGPKFELPRTPQFQSIF